jgi:isopenicillin-N N-acyltransferase-like protein
MKKHFPHIEVEGSAFDRGRQYGVAAGDRVAKSIEIYGEAFEKRGLAWEEVRNLARRYLRMIEEYEQDFAAEIAGIAEGAEQELEAVVAVNARTEILYQSYGPAASQDSSSDECTGAIALPETTGGGRLLHGQNWDWRPACIDSAVVVSHLPEEGPSFTTFTEAGSLARSGFNSRGIAVTGNFIQSDQDFGRSGIPIPLIRRKILQSASLAEALGAVLRSPRTFSSNHMISDALGEAINLEATPDEVFWTFPEDGLLVHSNHFKSLEAKTKLRDTGVARYPDTLYRDRRVTKELLKRRGQLTTDDFAAALRDHYGLPDSVCRHAAERPGGTVIATVASIIIDADAQYMLVAPGPVCENDFQRYENRAERNANAV